MIAKVLRCALVVVWLAIGAIGIGGFAGRWLVNEHLTARSAARGSPAAVGAAPAGPPDCSSGLERMSASAIAERMRAMLSASPEAFVAECIGRQPFGARAQTLATLSAAARAGDTHSERLVEAAARDACAIILALQNPAVTMADALIAGCAVVVRPETARFTRPQELQLVRLRWAADLALVMAGVASADATQRWCAAWPSVDAHVSRQLRAAFPDVDARYAAVCVPREDAAVEGGGME